MTLGDVISTYRKEHGLSMEKFGELAGMSKAYVSMLERNRTQRGDEPSPSFEMYRNVAKAMNVDVDELIRTVDGKVSFESPSYELPSNIIRRPFSRPTVPVVGQIACGTPILAEENIDGYVELPEQIRADYALVCKGDSMINAGIRDGDVVYIRQQDSVENGQIAAVMVNDGEATLKRFYRDGSTVSLIAENSAIPPMVFSGEEINRLRVIGLSVAYVHMLEK